MAASYEFTSGRGLPGRELVASLDELAREAAVDVAHEVLHEVRHSAHHRLRPEAPAPGTPHSGLHPTGVERGHEELGMARCQMVLHVHVERRLRSRVGRMLIRERCTDLGVGMLVPGEAAEPPVGEENTTVPRTLHAIQQCSHGTHGTEVVHLHGLAVDRVVRPLFVGHTGVIPRMLDVDAGVREQRVDDVDTQPVELIVELAKLVLQRHVEREHREDVGAITLELVALVGAPPRGDHAVAVLRELHGHRSADARGGARDQHGLRNELDWWDFWLCLVHEGPPLCLRNLASISVFVKARPVAQVDLLPLIHYYSPDMPRPLLEVQNITKSYGLQEVLGGISCFVAEGQKIALIGRNGAGKSTLMRILTGVEEVDTGSVLVHPWTKLGVINQHEVLPNDVSVLAYLERETQKADWQVKKMASQFALRDEHLAKKPLELSGGYQMRVKLVCMLLKDPTLLLLDEPVNYLDLQTLLLLERFLKNYRGSFVIIAHDREFLEETCTTTFEIERGRLTIFNGPVSVYLDWKAEQREFTIKQNKKLAREIAHQQKFVDRFRYKASLAAQAQSKLKYIDRLRRELKEEAVDLSTARVRVTCAEMPKGLALRAEGLAIGYGAENILARGITFDISRGEHILIAGENGSGKSTLLRTITGELEPLEGMYKWWHRSTIGYYNQFTEKSLIPNESVLQHLERMAPPNTAGERLLMMAGNFLFRGDDLDKPCSVLSGGERSRLCLAGLLLHEYNTLVLDEPSNHLDFETSEALAEALQGYNGTVIFVSHAQSFAKKVAHKVLEIYGGRVREFYGDYAAYVEEIKREAASSLEEEMKTKTPQTKLNAAALADRREIHMAIRALQKAQEKRTTELAKLEKEKGEILLFFFENPTDYAPEKGVRLHALEEQIAELERHWLRDEGQIENLRAELK